MSTTASYNIQVYFNLIHNILCNHFGIEKIDNLERKSAYVPIEISPQFQGKIEDPASVVMKFGEHEVGFDLIEQKLRQHYDIQEGATVEMLLPSYATGKMANPVGTSMQIYFTEEF